MNNSNYRFSPKIPSPRRSFGGNSQRRSFGGNSPRRSFGGNSPEDHLVVIHQEDQI